MKKLLFILTIILPIGAQATVVEQMLASYKSQGATSISAELGKEAWFKKTRSKKDGSMRSCTSCHTENLKQQGRHKKTNKKIDPLAPSVNAERLTEVKKIKKWFKRNCKWTYGRECTVQEKANFLAYIRTQ